MVLWPFSGILGVIQLVACIRLGVRDRRNVRAALAGTQLCLAGACTVDQGTLANGTNRDVGSLVRSWPGDTQSVCGHVAVATPDRTEP